MNREKNENEIEICLGTILNTKTGEIRRVDSVRDMTPDVDRKVEFLLKHIFELKNPEGKSEEEIKKIKTEAARHYFSTEEVPDNVIAKKI